MYVRSAPDSVYLVLSLISVLMFLSSNQRTRRRSDGWLGEAQKRHSTDASCIRFPLLALVSHCFCTLFS